MRYLFLRIRQTQTLLSRQLRHFRTFSAVDITSVIQPESSTSSGGSHHRKPVLKWRFHVAQKDCCCYINITHTHTHTLPSCPGPPPRMADGFPVTCLQRLDHWPCCHPVSFSPIWLWVEGKKWSLWLSDWCSTTSPKAWANPSEKQGLLDKTPACKYLTVSSNSLSTSVWQSSLPILCFASTFWKRKTKHSYCLSLTRIRM